MPLSLLPLKALTLGDTVGRPTGAEGGAADTAPSWGAPGREAAAAADEAIIPPMRAMGLAPAPAAIAAPNMLVLRAAVALGSAN